MMMTDKPTDKFFFGLALIRKRYSAASRDDDDVLSIPQKP